ncbi:MAG: hypothetical protein EKK41_14765 [Hyphomicrobiales bacterium]|nr:MAG: hypothetical protein EKK41_14765 [Hyphomicrobiales bacterium]
MEATEAAMEDVLLGLCAKLDAAVRHYDATPEEDEDGRELAHSIVKDLRKAVASRQAQTSAGIAAKMRALRASSRDFGVNLVEEAARQMWEAKLDHERLAWSIIADLAVEHGERVDNIDE